MTNKYSQSDLQISQTKEEAINYLRRISDELSTRLETSSPDEIEDILAKKAVVDYLSQHINYSKNFREGYGFTFGLPTKEIKRELADFNEEFDKSVQLFKKEGILDISMYDPKKHQFDAEAIMDKYRQEEYILKDKEYQNLFHPIERMRSFACYDPHLSDDADFYRIISPDELFALFKTKGTNKYIDSNGHFTNGHYSCITTNPNYNEQAFAFNGLPIRLKFKTKNKDGSYNMDLLNRINTLKQERSIYKVSGYNFDDIDWDNVFVSTESGWARLCRADIDELLAKLLS